MVTFDFNVFGVFEVLPVPCYQTCQSCSDHLIFFCFFPLCSSLLAYVLQVKVEMELEIQQCEKTKAVREEQLERLTQICQEQAVSI